MLTGLTAPQSPVKKPTQRDILFLPLHPSHPCELVAPYFWRTSVGITVALMVAASAMAQSRPQPELRLDVIGPRPYSVQPGVGATVSVGTYARVSAIVGYSLESDTNQIADRWRGDLLGRFLFDPFRQQRWGLSIGGGVSIRHRTYIAAVLDLEGPEKWGWLPAIHVGVGGGLRGGFVLRRAIERRR